MRSTWPEPLNRSDRQAAKRLQVPTTEDDGKPRANRSIKKDLAGAQLKQNTFRQVNDRRMDKILSKNDDISGENEELISFLNIQASDERKRLVNRLRARLREQQ